MLANVPTPDRPTLADVAAAAGVSRALVSIVVRGVPGASAPTRTRVLAIAAELGYRPDRRARLLRQRQPLLLGVMFQISQGFHADLVAATYRAADAVGGDVVLSGVAPGRSEHRAVETLLDERCGALILFGPTGPRAWLAELATRVAVVTVARRLRVDGVDTVRTADAHGVSVALDHLVDLRHRTIVHIDGGRAPGAADRRRGYRAAMNRHGLSANIEVLSGGGGEGDGARAASTLLARRRKPPTAVVAFNDACAVGALDTFLRAGVGVPDEISVVGFDDSHVAGLAHIDLTTVAQPVDELARAAVDRAIARLTARDDQSEPDGHSRAIEHPAGDAGSPYDVELPPTLVIRSTTAPPRRR